MLPIPDKASSNILRIGSKENYLLLIDLRVYKVTNDKNRKHGRNNR